MNTVLRRQEIINILNKEKEVSVNQLSKTLETSEVTIRSDLEFLSKNGKLVRTHGGAVLPEDPSYPKTIHTSLHTNYNEKLALAKSAATLVSDGDTIIIDSGSTLSIFSKFLHGKKITVVTGSLPVISELAEDDNIQLIIIGGFFRRKTLSSVGEFSTEVLSNINADMVFLGCSSFDINKGLTSPNLNEKITKQQMIKATNKVCLVADSSKSNKTELFNIASWSDINYFITDKISQDDEAYLNSLQIQVITAKN